MHRAVFFDLGGTLFSYRSVGEYFDRVLHELAARRGIEAEPDALRSAYRAAMLSVMGDFMDRDFYLHRDLFAEGRRRFLRQFGQELTAAEAAEVEAESQALFEPEISPRADAAETLGGLRARGLHVSIVSNIDQDQFEALWPGLGLGDHVDAVTTSEEARSCKPHRGIYDLALQKAGAPAPESVVFVGDSQPHDVAGANALGMTSVLIGRASADGSEPDHVIEQLSELLEIVR